VDEQQAMARAAELALLAGRTSPNPRVGCVLLAPDGAVVGEGWHRGAGQPHAEVEALHAAGDRARGATAVVTLEPCSHTGRTGPCTEALLAAGVARVVIGRRDPNPLAAGGAGRLAQAGVEVAELPAPDLNPRWERAVALGRPVVVWKAAATLDGRVAAADGTARWITGPHARREVHRLRAQVDAVLVGTGTVLADDPHLAVRLPEDPAPSQPLRVVVGARPIPPDARILDDAAPTLQIPEHDPATVLARLWDAGVRSVLLEGGPRIAAAFLAADLVDEIVWFAAPALLGAGPGAVAPFGPATIADARRFAVTTAAVVGADVRIDLVRASGGV
jgi:diaminohydroxyphosphoribosylaminopyrimidine deaminase/5-amino-6-(5-phosphoribosylamino)uracil reductase